MANTSFWDHPIDKLEEALNLKKQIHALQTKLSSMFGGDDDETGPAPAKRKPGRPPKSASPVASATIQPAKTGRKPFSAESRAKMAAAQRARWAGKKASSPISASSGPSKAKKKRTMSPEARARIAAAQRARWAKQKGR